MSLYSLVLIFAVLNVLNHAQALCAEVIEETAPGKAFLSRCVCVS
jgi:hypothetical protein